MQNEAASEVTCPIKQQSQELNSLPPYSPTLSGLLIFLVETSLNKQAKQITKIVLWLV